MSIATDISGQLAAATETIALPVSGYGTAGFQIQGTYSGTITFEGTVDGYTYQTLYATPTNSTTAATSTTSTGVWTAPVAGLFGIRLRMSSYTSGTATVKILGAITGGGSGGGSGGGGGAVTIADGADVAEGATTDAAVGDSSGTVNSHQRFVAKVLADVWNSVSHYLAVSIQNATLAVTQSGTWTVQPGNTANTTAWKVDGSAVSQPVVGNVANDGVDSGAPVKTGSRAVSFGANPAEVAAADRVDALASIAGIPFVLMGHPNIITRRDNYTSAQTDTKLITVSAGTKIVVLSCTIACDAAGTTKPTVRAGFAATTTPTGAGTYISHPGLSAGSGIAERTMVAGTDGDDFIFTCAVPTTGSIDVVTKYFTITS